MADTPEAAFQWGAGGARLTPDEIAQRRKDAAALVQAGTDGSPLPVGTRGAGVWTQGLARVAKAISGAMDSREADQAAKANASDNAKMIAALLGQGAQSAPTAAASAPASASIASAPPVGSAPASGDGFTSIPTTDGKDTITVMPGHSTDPIPSPLDPPSGDDRTRMIATILGEAGNEPQIGKNAVASVIRTRAVDGGYGGDTPSGVVTAPNQFEPWNTPEGRQRMAAAAADPAQAAAADAAIASAYGEGGKAPNDPTEGMTHFYSPAGQAAMGRAAPSWAGGESVTIGGHVFNSPDDAKPTAVASADSGAIPAAAAPTQGYAVPGAPPAAAAASPAAVAKVAAGLQNVNPAVLKALTSPYADDATKKIAGLLLTQQMTPKEVHAQETDKDGNIWDVNRLTGQRTVALKAEAADKPPSSVAEYEYYKKNFQPTDARPSAMGYDTWATAKARAGATNVTTTVGGENKGLDEAAKLDAEAVRKGQNEKMPALDDADRNFQIMQDAIDRNGGKLPTGGVLGKLGFDARRTSSYIRDNWGIDLGDDPTTATSLETFNKGGIKASGDLAKAIGGSRVLKVEFDMAQKANPGLETTDGGNKYLLDLNRNTIAIQKDHLQAQEDYWRAHNHSLDGFQREWNTEVKANPRPLSNFSVVPPVDLGDGSKVVKLPSTAQGGYSWYQKGPKGNTLLTDPAVISQAEDMTKPAPAAAKAVEEKTIGGKTYVKQDGNWFEKPAGAH